MADEVERLAAEAAAALWPGSGGRPSDNPRAHSVAAPPTPKATDHVPFIDLPPQQRIDRARDAPAPHPDGG